MGLLDTRHVDMLKSHWDVEEKDSHKSQKQVWCMIYKTGVGKVLEVRKESYAL